MINKVRHRIPTRSLGAAELRLLRVFASVVQHGGFSAAQSALGMTQATISTHMRHLEERLALRLCSRGRGGFQLTDEGRLVYEATLELFGSLEKFQSRIGEAQGELSGNLSFGTVDAMITNRDLDLQARSPPSMPRRRACIWKSTSPRRRCCIRACSTVPTRSC